jgi:hypothetical protein
MMIKRAKTLFGIGIAILITVTCLTYFETRPKLPIAENFKTTDGNLEIFVKLPVDLKIEEIEFSLVEKRASKVKLVFLELEGGNPEVIRELIRHENGDVTLGPGKEIDLNPRILDDVFSEIKDFYWVQSNHRLEFTEYQFLGKFVKEDLSEQNLDRYADEIIKSEKQRIVHEENEYVDIIVVIDDRDIRLPYAGQNEGRYLRDDWNLIKIASIQIFIGTDMPSTLIHEIGHSSFILFATDWRGDLTPEYYDKRPFIGLVDYDVYGIQSRPLSFTAANKVGLAGLEYATITGTPPYERTITLTPTPELTDNTPVYKVPLEFVSDPDIGWDEEANLRSYVFDLRNDVEGGQGVYIQEIVEAITSSFDHIYIKPQWSTTIPRKTIDDPVMGIVTIPQYMSNRTQANDGRVTDISDEFVDVALVDEEWSENFLRSATIRIKVKKQDLSPPTYKSKIYLTEFNGMRIAYVMNDGFAIRPVVFERNGRVSFYPPIGGEPNKLIWVFTPLDASIKHSDDAINLVDQKYRLMPVPAGVIEKLNQDFNLSLTSEIPPVTGEDITVRGFVSINVFIKEGLENPIIGFVYFDPMSENFKGIFVSQW